MSYRAELHVTLNGVECACGTVVPPRALLAHVMTHRGAGYGETCCLDCARTKILEVVDEEGGES